MNYRLKYLDLYYAVENYVEETSRNNANFSKPTEIINVCSFELPNVDENKVRVVFKGRLSTNIIHILKKGIDKQAEKHNFVIVYGNTVGYF